MTKQFLELSLIRRSAEELESFSFVYGWLRYKVKRREWYWERKMSGELIQLGSRAGRPAVFISSWNSDRISFLAINAEQTSAIEL